MTDDEFIDRFEAGTLEGLPHADHVRMAILYLDRHGYPEALWRLTDGLRLFARSKGHPEKFHVTLTRAWLDLVDAARQACPGAAAAEVVERWPALLESGLLGRFYSTGRLDTDTARTSWVEPDLAPLSTAALGASGTTV